MALKEVVLLLVLVVSHTKSKISTKSSSLMEEKPINNRNIGMRKYLTSFHLFNVSVKILNN